MDNTYLKTVECLQCGKSYQTRKLRSKSVKVESVDTDFFNNYVGDNPYFYEVNVCPHCYFAHSDNFKRLLPVQKKNVGENYCEKVGAKQDFTQERTIDDAIKATKLSLICADVSDQYKQTVAGVCLKIAWLYRIKQDEKEEKRFLALALDNYIAAFDKGSNLSDEYKLMYLIGELNFRLGNMDKVQKWFQPLINNRDVSPAVANQVKSRWLDYKEANSKSVA